MNRTDEQQIELASPFQKKFGQQLNQASQKNMQSQVIRTADLKFTNDMDYLAKITTGFNTRDDVNIETICKSLSNQFMSVMVVQINRERVCTFYNDCAFVLRGYRNRQKFFEMPIPKRIKFIDIYNSTIAYVLEDDDKKFYAIDVGRAKDETREIEEDTQGQAEPREMEHEFDEEVLGFKLGHFNLPLDGNMKAVFWSEQKVYIFPFNPDESKEEKSITVNRDVVDIDSDVSVKRILDFGVRPEKDFDYESDKPEALLVLDEDDILHVMKGETYGKEWKVHIKYDNSDKDEEWHKIAYLHDMVLVQTSKLVGVIEKVPEGKANAERQLFMQVMEFKMEDEDCSPLMTRDFGIIDTEEDSAKKFIRQELCLDGLNNVFYLRDFGKKDEEMQMLPISNNMTGKAEALKMNTQIALNIIANNTLYTQQQKTRGLLYQDFLCAENLLILLHGKVISCYDLVDKDRLGGHLVLNDDVKNKKDFYNFDHEPRFIWMMDKTIRDTTLRWKAIVAFNNGDVKEVVYKIQNDEIEFKLQDYLKYPQTGLLANKARTLPGKIEKVLRNRNSKNQPIYLIIRKADTNKRVLATIEFQSKTYREFEVPGIDPEQTKFIILDNNDTKMQWQEVICIESKEDKQSEVLEQKLVHIKIRIGQFQLLEKGREIVVLNKEILQTDMENVSKASDIFVSGNFIYFVQKANGDKKAHIDKYNILDNSHTKSIMNENVVKLRCFDNKFFYWRTILGGYNKDRYFSKIYFDGIDNFPKFSQQCSNQDIKVFEGNYPHINKLQIDYMSNSIACFTDFNQFKVFPLLHIPKIKIKCEGNKDTDDHIIATKLFKEMFLITLHQSNKLKAWNMKVGKYMMVERQIKQFDLSKYIWHQRISDDLTLIRTKSPIFDSDEDAIAGFHPKYNWTDTQNEIRMYKYKIIKLSLNSDGNAQPSLDQIQLEVIKSFVGPHVYNQPNYGLFSGDELDLFAFFYKDSQDKLQLQYCRITDQKYEDDDEFSYLQQFYNAQTADDAKLSIHSPNFKLLVYNVGIKEYQIKDFENKQAQSFLPKNLNENTIEFPNFITNDTLMFLTEDKIIKGYNYVQNQEEFMITNCHFPGSTEEINLATLLKVGDKDNIHIIGENCLTYYRVKEIKVNEETKQEEEIVKELIAPNNFNQFFLESSGQFNADSDDASEIKIIQCHYKNKVELDQRSIFGYFFQQDEVSPNKFSQQLFIISTYTFYEWRILNLIKSKKLNAFDLPNETIQSLSYVQLPNGQTLLHQLYKNKFELEYIFTEIGKVQVDGCPFYIPLFKDRKDKTALDYAIGNPDNDNDPNKSMDKIQQQREDITDGDVSQETVKQRKSADLILKHVGQYPFGLFKVELKPLIETMIQEQLMEFAQFMDNSAKTPSFLKSIDRAQIEVDETCGCGVFEVNDVWTTENEITYKKKFESGKEEKLIQLKVLDIPEIHHFTNGKNNLIYQALSDTDNEAIFQITAIKALIEQKWPLTKSNVIWKLLLPYLCFLFIFSIYTVGDFETSLKDWTMQKNPEKVYTDAYWDTPEFKSAQAQNFTIAIICRVVIILFTCYFFGIEIYQCSKDDSIQDHFSDFWNWLDIVAPILIFVAEIMNITDGQDMRIIRTLYSFCALAMWLRFLYFFRIFKQTNFYIRMIIQVIVDCGQFFFIFLISVVSFAHTYYIFFLNHTGIPIEDDNGVVTGYGQSEFTGILDSLLNSYKMAFGQFEFGNYPLYLSWVAYFYFIAQTLIVIIILLNLLISIVGNTFGAVNDAKANMMYQDMVDLIVENQFLINEQKQATLNNGKYLMLVVLEDQQVEQQEIIQQNFLELKQQINDIQVKNEQQLAQNSYNVDRILKAQKQMQDQIAELLRKFDNQGKTGQKQIEQ